MANRLQRKYIESDFTVGKISKEKRDEMLVTFVDIIAKGNGFAEANSMSEPLITSNVCSEDLAERHVQTLVLTSLKAALVSLDLATDGSEDVQRERLINRLQG